jgi:hypothetical protein
LSLKSRRLNLLPKNHGIASPDYSELAFGRDSLLGAREEIQGGVETELEVFRLIDHVHLAACHRFLLDYRQTGNNPLGRLTGNYPER